MMQKNICIFIRALKVGGAEKQSLFLAKALQNYYATTLVVLHGEMIDQKYLSYIVENKICLRLLKGNLINKIYQFGKFLSEKRINVIFSYLAINNLISAILGKYLNVKFIIGGIRNSYIVRHKLLVQKILHNNIFNYTIFNNYSGANNLVNKGFKENKIHIIPNCIELNSNTILKQNTRDINIITVGRFTVSKDYETAIKTIQNVNQSLKNINVKCYYKIIGYGNLELQIRKWIIQYEQDDFINIVINPNDLNSFYLNADIYLCTSIFEGLSNSIMEAMAYKLPIVATNVGDNSYLVKNGINGYLNKVNDYIGISSNVRRLILNHKDRVKFGANSYDILKNRYTFKNFQEAYLSLINELN